MALIQSEANPAPEFPDIAPAPEFEEQHAGPIVAMLYVSCLLFPVLAAGLLYMSGRELHQMSALWSIALAIPLSWLISDLMSGLVHWMCDTYGSISTPILGPSIIHLFRVHHVLPKDICNSNIVMTIGHACVWIFLLLCGLLGLNLLLPPSLFVALFTFTATTVSFLVVLTNQFHKWAHASQVPGWIQLLQNSRLILTKPHHDVHHQAPFETYYCITNGWLNPLLAKINFFRRMEQLWARLGLRPSLK